MLQYKNNNILYTKEEEATTMIIGAKWIITGDGKTVLENAAVRIDEMGKTAFQP